MVCEDDDLIESIADKLTLNQLTISVMFPNASFLILHRRNVDSIWLDVFVVSVLLFWYCIIGTA